MQISAKQEQINARRAYTVPEFIAVYGVSRTRTYAEIGSGRLTARRLGGRTIITHDDAENWLASLPAHRPTMVQHGRAAL